MSDMPKWLIPVVITTWLSGGIAAYYGYWLPVVVLLGLGILAATAAAGMLWANRSALRVAKNAMTEQAARSMKETGAEATERRRQEVNRRHERNRKRRRGK